MERAHLTHIKNLSLLRIEPQSEHVVHFAYTARVPALLSLVSSVDLSLYGALVMTGTKRWTKSDLEAYLRRYGIDIKVQTGRTSVTFSGTVRSVHVDKVVSVLKELIFSPTLSDGEFKKKRTLFLESNREEHDNAKRIAHTAFINALYPDEPHLALLTLKEEKVLIEKARRVQVERIKKSLATASWFVSIVATDSVTKKFTPLLRELSQHASVFTPTPITGNTVTAKAFYETVPSKTNIEVLIGNITKTQSETREYIAFDFGIDVLGKMGGFSGRLMSTVREKEGLTYGIYAALHTHYTHNPFHFAIKTFFMEKDYEKGMQSTLRELTAIYKKGISETELSTFKEIAKNEFILAHESNKSRLATYHHLYLKGSTERDVHAHYAILDSLTVDEVNTALRNNINLNALVISAAGPITKEGKPIISK